MKAARRQELKANELQQFLKEAGEFFRKYGNYFVGALVVIALIALGYVYMTRSAAQALADARQEMNSLPFATDEEVRDSIAKLERLASENDSETFVVDTLRRRAGMAMNRAQAADDGTPSEEFLGLARTAYEEILQQFPERHLDVAAALIGLATIEEDLFVLDDDLTHKDAAREYLERIRDNPNLNGTPFQTVALDRLNALDETFVQVVMVEAAPEPAADSPFKLSDELPSTTPPAEGGAEDAADTPPPQPAGGATETPAVPTEEPDAAVPDASTAETEPPPGENEG
jgi:hypothetical protein